MPSWAWFIAGVFTGAQLGMLTFGALSIAAFSDLEASELHARHEVNRLNGLLAEITDSKEAV